MIALVGLNKTGAENPNPLIKPPKQYAPWDHSHGVGSSESSLHAVSSRKERYALAPWSCTLSPIERSTRPVSDDLLCRAADTVRHPLNAEHILHYAPAFDRAYLLTTADSAVLNYCGTMKTLKGHAEYIKETGKLAGSPKEISMSLRRLVNQGVLIDTTALLSRCLQAQPASTRGLETIVMPSRDRPFEAKRCAESFLGNALAAGRNVELIVADGSADYGVQALYSEQLKQIAKSGQSSIRYCGAEQKREWIARCESAGIPQQVISYALFGTPIDGTQVGSNQNALLLDTLGRLILSVDDDTLCIPYMPPDSFDLQSLALWGEEDPQEAWFYEANHKLPSNWSAGLLDVLGQHERLLGRSLQEAIVESYQDQASVALEAPCDHMLLDQGKARVLIVLNGIAGDSGTHLPLLFHKQNATHERLRTFVQDDMSRLRSRVLLRSSRQRALTHEGGVVMSTFMSSDNSRLLPPFMPTGRNQDGLYGLLLHACYPGSYKAYLPFALYHNPQQTRLYPHDLHKHFSKARYSDILRFCINAFTPLDVSQQAIERLTSLGKWLVNIGTISTPSFMAFIRPAWLAWLSHLAQQIDRERVACSHSSPWRPFLDRMMEQVATTSSNAYGFAPSDFSQEASPQLAITIAQQEVARLGELLTWWPAIIHCSQMLVGRGVRLSVPL